MHWIRASDNRDEYCRQLVHPRAGCVLLGAKLDTGDVMQSHNGFARGPGTHDDVAELLRIAEPSDRIDLELECRAGRGRRLSQFAGGHLDVLLCDRGLDVGCGDAEGGEVDRSVGEVRLMPSRMLGSFLVMMTPAWLTMAGSCAAAWETRFCTSTAAVSIGK